MTNKYYKPQIEELHLGYIVESHEMSSDMMGVPELNYDRWVTKELDASYLTTILKYGVRSIRIKCLDREDIEAEGWVYVKSYGNEKYGFYHCFERLPIPEYTMNCKDFLTLEEREIPYIEIHNNEHYDEHQTWYKGNCPSKNELITIQKLLGI